MKPDQDGYQIDAAVTTLQAKLLGGGMKLRRDALNAPAKVSVTWTCSDAEYDYLLTFYRTTNDGTIPFLMDLIMDNSVLTEHECRFMPGTFKVSTIKGNARKIAAQLEVVPLPPDDAYDEGLVTTFEAFGTETSESLGVLATLVNVNMPANIK